MKSFWGPGQFQIDWLSIWASLRQVLFLILSFAVEKLAEWVAGTDFGDWTPAVVGVCLLLINLARKFLKDYSGSNP